MIIDDLKEFERYIALNPLFAAVADFLATTDLSMLPTGITHIQGDDLYVNVQEAPAKTRQEARFETHRRMIDIQIPISGDEEHGWTPAYLLPQADYNAESDMTLHDPTPPLTPVDIATTYYTLRRGQFAIYFPTDGHAPAVTPTGLRKAIFKVKV